MKKSLFRLFYDGDRDISREGSFTVALFKIFMLADSENKLRLLLGFPNFFSQDDYIFFCGEPSKTIKS